MRTATKTAMTTTLLALSFITVPALAQVTPQEHTVTESQAGLVNRTSTARVSVVVTAIDKAKRKLTLKAPDGRVFDVIAGSEVRNFDQIKVKDAVNVAYLRSVTLDLKKPGETASPSASSIAARAEPGAQPGAFAADAITIVADVIDVNPANKTIALQGPQGNIVELDVKNPDQFKVVKKGDKVEVTYAEAIAISVEPATKKEVK